MSDTKVGMPTMGGAKEALIDYGLGLGGGIVYALSSAFLGSGFIGGLVGAILAGSMIKGTRGSIIATILGFQSIVGSAQAQPTASSGGNQDVM